MVVPYIGITGFTSRLEVMYLLREAPILPSRKLMVGVLLNKKGMYGWGRPTSGDPVPQHIAGIFQNYTRTLNLIHYHSKDNQTLCAQLLDATKLGGEFLHGFQLNMAWPSPLEIDDYKMHHPEKKIVLQIGRRAFEAIDNSPKTLAKKIKGEYEGLVEYILLDRSGGHGQLLDVGDLRQYLRAIRDSAITAGLVVAGGLSPSTIHLLEPLVEEFADMSWDAESALQDHDNTLDLLISKEYLLQSTALLAHP